MSRKRKGADAVTPFERRLTHQQQRAWLAYMRVQLRLSYEMNRQLQNDSGLSLADYDVLNALRYSPAAAPPLLTARTAGNRVELRVVDHGPGIAAADWKRVFQPFCRLGALGDSTGVGLGLAVARGLAETIGGTVEPEDTPRRRAHPPRRQPPRLERRRQPGNHGQAPARAGRLSRHHDPDHRGMDKDQ